MTNPHEAPGVASPPPVLEVSDLRVAFHTQSGVVQAVNGISYELHRGETLALIGESGSGKSVGVRAVMGILRADNVEISGSVTFDGTELLGAPQKVLQTVRGHRVGMIFQDSFGGLNPVFSVGEQIAELFRVHRGLGRRESKEEAIELMERVAIPLARERASHYPHEFSGGMRQRVMIAMAIALDPEVVIADEPTTALDVTVQAQILELLSDLQEATNMGLVLITHDAGVVAEVADRVAVMYAGTLMEVGDTVGIYENPAHPYTKGLLDSTPFLDDRSDRLVGIEGSPPPPSRIPPGCSFNPRCSLREDICSTKGTNLVEVAPGRFSSCHFGGEFLDQTIVGQQ